MYILKTMLNQSAMTETITKKLIEFQKLYKKDPSPQYNDICLEQNFYFPPNSKNKKNKKQHK